MYADQPGRLLSLIRVFAVSRIIKVARDQNLLRADSKDCMDVETDQAAVFAWCSCDFVHSLQLKFCEFQESVLLL